MTTATFGTFMFSVTTSQPHISGTSFQQVLIFQDTPPRTLFQICSRITYMLELTRLKHTFTITVLNYTYGHCTA